jgi:hypothetical protein
MINVISIDFGIYAEHGKTLVYIYSKEKQVYNI